MSFQQQKNVISSLEHSPQAPLNTFSRSWKVALGGLAAEFVILMICYGFVTPAWEANDELDHVANTEYAVTHPLTFMPIAYESWHETHQPPLYYWLASAYVWLVWSSAFAGLLAVFIIARQTTHAEGRIAFVALGAFAILLSLGDQSVLKNTVVARFGLILWPMTLALLDLYVMIRFVLPLRQL